MKKIFIFCFLAMSCVAFSQVNPDEKPIMGFYFNPSINAGFNLKKEQEVINNTQYIEPQPLRRFTYGITAMGGYNFLPNFALGTGLKYSYIKDNFHLVYWVIQPKIIFGPGDEAFYIDLNYGKQINNSAVSNSEFWGARFGLQISYSKRLSQEGGIFFEGYKFGGINPFFVGLSYGITVFSNKNYTIEGID